MSFWKVRVFGFDVKCPTRERFNYSANRFLRKSDLDKFALNKVKNAEFVHNSIDKRAFMSILVSS